MQKQSEKHIIFQNLTTQIYIQHPQEEKCLVNLTKTTTLKYIYNINQINVKCHYVYNDYIFNMYVHEKLVTLFMQRLEPHVMLPHQKATIYCMKRSLL